MLQVPDYYWGVTCLVVFATVSLTSSTDSSTWSASPDYAPAPHALWKRDANDDTSWPEGEDEEKRAKYFLGKRLEDQHEENEKRAKYFLGKRLDDEDEEKRAKYFLGKRLEEQDEEKRAKYFLGKRGRNSKYFLGKRSFWGSRSDEDDMSYEPILRRRAKYFLGKRADDAEYFDGDDMDKRARYFLGKRAKYFLGKRVADELDEMKRAKYFLGKRDADDKRANYKYFLGKRSTVVEDENTEE